MQGQRRVRLPPNGFLNGAIGQNTSTYAASHANKLQRGVGIGLGVAQTVMLQRVFSSRRQ